MCQLGAESHLGKGAAAKETLCLIRKHSQEMEHLNSNSEGTGKQKTGKSKRLLNSGNVLLWRRRRTEEGGLASYKSKQH